jgi:ABC-type antimicrobial peptide transport system permease subunit
MIIRSTLGASRVRLLGQLLLETALLSILGGATGALIAWYAVEIIKQVSPEDFRRFQDVHLDATALAVVFCLTLLVASLSGLLPALSLSKTNAGSVLKDEGGRSGTVGRHRQRLQSLLVAGSGSARLRLADWSWFNRAQF